MEKATARKKYMQLRNSLTDGEREYKSRNICKALLALEVFRQSKYLYSYLSYGTEAGTREIVLESLRLGKRVFVPKVYPDRKMEFFEIFSFDELRPGFRGILEPDLEKLGQRKPFCESGLMLVPGLAFEMGGQRLGYGGGYYDAYLSRFSERHFYKLGLCFQVQVAESLSWPLEASDIPVDGILTEQGLHVRWKNSYGSNPKYSGSYRDMA